MLNTHQNLGGEVYPYHFQERPSNRFLQRKPRLVTPSDKPEACLGCAGAIQALPVGSVSQRLRSEAADQRAGLQIDSAENQKSTTLRPGQSSQQIGERSMARRRYQKGSLFL